MTEEQLEALKRFFMVNNINPSSAVIGMTDMIGVILQTSSVSANARAKAIELLKAIEIMLNPQ